MRAGVGGGGERLLLFLDFSLLLQCKVGKNRGEMGMLFWTKSRSPLILQNYSASKIARLSISFLCSIYGLVSFEDR